MIPESILNFMHAGKSLPFRSMTFFNFLLEATLAGSLLILVVLVLRKVFRKQIGSRLVYLAWALVAIRLLVPLAIPNPLMDEFRPTNSIDAGARPVADQVRVRYTDTLTNAAYHFSVAANESGSRLGKGLSSLCLELAAYTSYGWFGKGYLLLYGIGCLITAGLFAFRHIRFRGKLKKGIVGDLEGTQLAVYHDLCRGMGVKPLPVVYADPLPTPCLVGVLRPVIALPLMLPPESLREALMHELCHYQRKDPWWVLLKCICCVIHWFNPLVWIGQGFVRMDCEFACDESVAARLNGDERLHYANTLVLTAKQAYAPGAGVLATGMTMTGKRLKRRINAIIQKKAVRKAAASFTAAVLITLTVAAFSTSESLEQMKRITSDPSAFPFLESDTYPAPESAFGSPVGLTQINNAYDAEEQAKRYLLALYPERQAEIESGLDYVADSSNRARWQVTASLSGSNGSSRYVMGLDSAGRLINVRQTDLFSNGEERYNTITILPGNIKDVILAYGREVSAAVLQNVELTEASVQGDWETDEQRFIGFDLTGPSGIGALITAQIAPEFLLSDLFNNVAYEAESPETPPAAFATQALVYSEDASIRFDAIPWWDSDSRYRISPDANLMPQQAFDIAVATMLEKSGLTKEAFLALQLEYGYYDKHNFGGELSVWRFVWYVDMDDPMSRYWVELSDVLLPESVTLSKPGEGLG